MPKVSAEQNNISFLPITKYQSPAVPQLPEPGGAEALAASLSPQLLQASFSFQRNGRNKRNTFNKAFQELLSARIGNRRWRII